MKKNTGAGAGYSGISAGAGSDYDVPVVENPIVEDDVQRVPRQYHIIQELIKEWWPLNRLAAGPKVSDDIIEQVQRLQEGEPL